MKSVENKIVLTLDEIIRLSSLLLLKIDDLEKIFRITPDTENFHTFIEDDLNKSKLLNDKLTKLMHLVCDFAIVEIPEGGDK